MGLAVGGGDASTRGGCRGRGVLSVARLLSVVRLLNGVEVELASIQLYYGLSICSVTERHAAVDANNLKVKKTDFETDVKRPACAPGATVTVLEPERTVALWIG